MPPGMAAQCGALGTCSMVPTFSRNALAAAVVARRLVVGIRRATLRPVVRLAEVAAVLAGIVGAVDIASLVAMDAVDIATGGGLRRLGHEGAPLTRSTGASPAGCRKKTKGTIFFAIRRDPPPHSSFSNSDRDPFPPRSPH